MPGWELIDKKEKKAVSILFDQLKDGIKPIFYNSEKVKLFEKILQKKLVTSTQLQCPLELLL